MGTDKVPFAEVRWGATGSGRDRKWRHRTESDLRHVTRRGPDQNRKWSRNRYILYCYSRSTTTCSIVVQVLWLPEVIEGHVTPKDVIWGCGRMRNQKLRKICPGGDFFTGSDVIKRHVTPKGVPLENMGARMRNWKLRNIRTNVTCRASHGRVECATECALGVWFYLFSNLLQKRIEMF